MRVFPIALALAVSLVSAGAMAQTSKTTTTLEPLGADKQVCETRKEEDQQFCKDHFLKSPPAYKACMMRAETAYLACMRFRSGH